jgi:hypothetical protein
MLGTFEQNFGEHRKQIFQDEIGEPCFVREATATATLGNSEIANSLDLDASGLLTIAGVFARIEWGGDGTGGWNCAEDHQQLPPSHFAGSCRSGVRSRERIIYQPPHLVHEELDDHEYQFRFRGTVRTRI